MDIRLIVIVKTIAQSWISGQIVRQPLHAEEKETETGKKRNDRHFLANRKGRKIPYIVQDLPYRPVNILGVRAFLIGFVIYSPWTSKLQEVIFQNRWHNAARA